MKIYNKIVYDINDNIIEEDSYEYEGPLTLADPVTAAVVVGGASVMQFTQQGAIGKYNQAANNRTAAVLDGQAAQIEQKAEFDIAQFNKTYQKVKGETIQFKSKPAYWYLVSGTKKGFTYNQFNLMVKLSKETYFTAYSEIYGSDKIDERICESLLLLDNIEFLQ